MAMAISPLSLPFSSHNPTTVGCSPQTQIRKKTCMPSISNRPLFPNKSKTLTLTLASSSSTSVPSATAATECPGITETGNFTISDETLSSKGFKFHTTLEGIDLDSLNTLFVKVGFPRREKRKLEMALQNTPSLLWLQEVRSQNLVAFARATGDDVFNAIIWDVVVDPSYQGLGLGKALMERLMFALLQKGITNICLFAEPNVVSFYKPLGYISDPQGIRAMSISKKGK